MLVIVVVFFGFMLSFVLVYVGIFGLIVVSFFNVWFRVC